MLFNKILRKLRSHHGEISVLWLNATLLVYDIPHIFQDVLHGESNTYSILCKAFMTYVLEQPESDQALRFDQSDMIQVL